MPRVALSKEHGTLYRYDKGCHCTECRAANARRQYKWRTNNLSKPVPEGAPHGSLSTYNNYGCKCAPCREANRMKDKK